MSLALRLLPGELSILKLPPDAAFPPWLSFLAQPLVSGLAPRMSFPSSAHRVKRLPE